MINQVNIKRICDLTHLSESGAQALLGIFEVNEIIQNWPSIIKFANLVRSTEIENQKIANFINTFSSVSLGNNNIFNKLLLSYVIQDVQLGKDFNLSRVSEMVDAFLIQHPYSKFSIENENVKPDNNNELDEVDEWEPKKLKKRIKYKELSKIINNYKAVCKTREELISCVGKEANIQENTATAYVSKWLRENKDIDGQTAKFAGKRGRRKTAMLNSTLNKVKEFCDSNTQITKKTELVETIAKTFGLKTVTANAYVYSWIKSSSSDMAIKFKSQQKPRGRQKSKKSSIDIVKEFCDANHNLEKKSDLIKAVVANTGLKESTATAYVGIWIKTCADDDVKERINSQRKPRGRSKISNEQEQTDFYQENRDKSKEEIVKAFAKKFGYVVSSANVKVYKLIHQFGDKHKLSGRGKKRSNVGTSEKKKLAV